MQTAEYTTAVHFTCSIPFLHGLVIRIVGILGKPWGGGEEYHSTGTEVGGEPADGDDDCYDDAQVSRPKAKIQTSKQEDAERKSNNKTPHLKLNKGAFNYGTIHGGPSKSISYKNRTCGCPRI